jgi:hypothetical protein
MPRDLTGDMALSEGSIRVGNPLARRVLVSVEPKGAVGGARILSSTLTITPFGGTLRSWANVDRGIVAHSEPQALEVDRSMYRVAPFLTGTLRPQSRAVDLVVVPGGGPVDALAVNVEPLWNPDHGPVRPESVSITLAPLRHFTNYGRVEANVKVDIVGAPMGPARAGWNCPVEQRVTLVDLDAVRPPLWDIGMGDRGGGRRKLWLVFNSNASGPFRAIFASPAVATDFLAWLRKVRVTRVAQYDLGIFRPERPANGEDVFISSDRDIMASFATLDRADLDNLQVGSLDEP